MIINNLFDCFNPIVLMNLPLNWLSSLTVLFFIPVFFWTLKSMWMKSFNLMTMTLKNEFSSSFGTMSTPGMLLSLVTLFYIIMINNFMGLFPYVFTSSSHLVFSLSMALPLWIGHMIMAATININSTLAHLVPLGAPNALAPFMVLIELISSAIRPLTLAVRLAANMIAGHLLMVLISSSMVSANSILLSLTLMGLLMLTVLEMAVTIIQAYVFSLLSSLYMAEVNSKKFF